MNGAMGGKAMWPGGAATSQYCCWAARVGSGVGAGGAGVAVAAAPPGRVGATAGCAREGGRAVGCARVGGTAVGASGVGGTAVDGTDVVGTGVGGTAGATTGVDATTAAGGTSGAAPASHPVTSPTHATSVATRHRIPSPHCARPRRLPSNKCAIGGRQGVTLKARGSHGHDAGHEVHLR